VAQGTTAGSVAAASASFAAAFASASDEVDGASGTTASEDAPLVATPRSAARTVGRRNRRSAGPEGSGFRV
jgi:hypothetical protein